MEHFQGYHVFRFFGMRSFVRESKNWPKPASDSLSQITVALLRLLCPAAYGAYECRLVLAALFV